MNKDELCAQALKLESAISNGEGATGLLMFLREYAPLLDAIAAAKSHSIDQPIFLSGLRWWLLENNEDYNSDVMMNLSKFMLLLVGLTPKGI